MNGRRTKVRECAQKNGKIDENSNEDKEEFDAKSYTSGYIDDDVTDDDDNDDNNNNSHFEDIDEVIIMGIERQLPASDAVESSAPKPTSAILSTVTVTATSIPTTSPKAQRRFECFRIIVNNHRQIKSVSPGFLLVMSQCFQMMYGLNQLVDHRGNLPRMVFCLVAIYYFGAILGAMAAAVLIPIIRKRTIHVGTTGHCLWIS